MSDFVQTPSFKLAIYAKGDPKAKKVALVMPGRLDTKDYIHMTSHVDLLGQHGFYAASFDPPFTWESPGDIKNYSMTNYVKAVNELIEYFGNRPTLLVGHSRGGAVAQVASANPHVIGLVLAMASYEPPTPPDPAAVKGSVFIDYRDLPPGNTRTKEKKQMATPLNYFIDTAKYNQVDYLRQFNGPKLMICGTRDEFITPKKVKKIFDSLAEPKTFFEMDVEHDYRLHADILKSVNNAILEFIQTSVK